MTFLYNVISLLLSLPLKAGLPEPAIIIVTLRYLSERIYHNFSYKHGIIVMFHNLNQYDEDYNGGVGWTHECIPLI